MNINRIDIVSVPVTDQQKSKEFYENILGFEVIRDNPMPPDQRWVQLAPPNSETSITLVTWFDNMPPGSFQGAVLDTDDIELSYEILKSRGLELSPIKEEPWGEYVTFSDPDGNGWVLQQASENA